jgi:hypothetical protein
MQTDANHTTKPATNPATNGEVRDEFAAASARLRSEVDETLSGLRRVLFVEWQALELSFFDTALRAAVFLGLGVVAIAMAVSAGLLAVASARRGLAILFQDAWWSDLALGLVVGAVLSITAVAVRRGVHRSALERTRVRLAQDRRTPNSAEGLR